MDVEIDIGREYRNIHSGRVCTVISKIFFNIQYRENGGSQFIGYVHYKRFRKNWRAV